MRATRKPNWQNKTIWTGDNLAVMRGMNSETVDLIYLDPPFNSNRDYAAPVGSEEAVAAFKDTWTLSDLDEAWLGHVANKAPILHRVIEAAGYVHGEGMQSYLTMMAVRLLEMRRLLKPTGSIYLHCDPTASHYLKLLMDAIFGADNFRNEIVWMRTTAKALVTKRLPSNHDLLLSYKMADHAVWDADASYVPYDPNALDAKTSGKYRHRETDGRLYRLDNLTNPNRNRPNLTYEFLGVKRVWRWTRERMQAAYDSGVVVQTKPGGVPQLKRYLDDQKGRPLGDIWTDIPPLNSQAKERIGYPTQKPLALLDRIMKMSSREGDVILDPFCGCATSCVAADRMGRQWTGIDLSPLAAELVKERLRGEQKMFYDIVHRTNLPTREDMTSAEEQEYLDASKPEKTRPYNCAFNKETLFGRQRGKCRVCSRGLDFALFQVDHIVPKVEGGGNELSNLQLLCSECNTKKGTASMAVFMSKHIEAKAKELRELQEQQAKYSVDT